MKILFLGHYREGNTGWSRAAQELITAFDAVGADIVCRPVVLNGGGTPSDTVLKCEARSVRNCDVVIQCLLPHHLVYDGNFKKNITIPFLETHMGEDNDWLNCLNLMDEVWISSGHLINTSLLCRTNKVKQIKIPTDIEKYNHKHFSQKIQELYDDHVFYYVGDVNKRKNIGDTVRAFFLEFTKNEPVSLVLKVNKFGMNQHEVYELVNRDIKQIADTLRLYKNFEDYKPITIISNDLQDEAIYGLHQMFDTYVSTSMGEGWNFPLVDAWGFGNHVVTTNFPLDTMIEYSDGEEEFGNQLITAVDEPVNGMMGTFDYQFTGRDSWDKPWMKSIRGCMRDRYNLGKVKTKRDLSEISYETCGQHMMELLYESN